MHSGLLAWWVRFWLVVILASAAWAFYLHRSHEARLQPGSDRTNTPRWALTAVVCHGHPESGDNPAVDHSANATRPLSTSPTLAYISVQRCFVPQQIHRGLIGLTASLSALAPAGLS